MRPWKREDFSIWLALTVCGVVGGFVGSSTEPFLKAVTLAVLSGVTTGGAFYFLAWFVLWRKRR